MLLVSLLLLYSLYSGTILLLWDMKGRKLRTDDFVTYLIRHAGATLRARELRQIFCFFQNDQLILG